MDEDVVLESDMPDVSETDLDQLIELPESVFDMSLRRLLRDRVNVQTRYSIFEASS